MSGFLRDLSGADADDRVHDEHFGLNAKGTVNFYSSDGPFAALLSTVPTDHLRFPGGTITEEYLVPGTAVWDGFFHDNGTGFVDLPDGEKMASVPAMMAYAEANDIDVRFVLPTEGLFRDVESGSTRLNMTAVNALLQSIDKLLAGDYGDAKIAALEIGNEYYYKDRMSAEQYGSLADFLAPKLADLIEANGLAGPNAPVIAAQSGAGWNPGDNETILSELGAEAREAISAVITHYYPATLALVDNNANHQEQAARWEDEPGFGSLEFWVSEWNIHNKPFADNGFLQASSLISAFEQMLDYGVDAASFWGTQYEYLTTSMSVLSSEDDPSGAEHVDVHLTATGHIYQSMAQSVVGLSAFDVNPRALINTRASMGDVNSEPDLMLNAFGDQDRAVMYLSNRTDAATKVTVKLADYFGDFSHFSGVLYEVGRDNPDTEHNEADATDGAASTIVQTINLSAVQDGLLTITLPPYAILEFSVQVSDNGVVLAGDLQPDDVTYSLSDWLEGSANNDSLLGHLGEDIISGGDGSDNIRGGADDDVLIGGRGADWIIGEDGDDFLIGGVGRDQLRGAAGNDTLMGSAGSDSLYGGDGDDTLYLGGGNDIAFGGDGTDHFVVTGGGDTVIGFMQFGRGETISFGGEFASAAELRANTITRGNDAVIRHMDGSTTTIRGAGNDLNRLMSSVTDFGPNASHATYTPMLNAAAAIGSAEFFRRFDDLAAELSPEGLDWAAILSGLNDQALGHLVNGMTDNLASQMMLSFSIATLDTELFGFSNMGDIPASDVVLNVIFSMIEGAVPLMSSVAYSITGEVALPDVDSAILDVDAPSAIPISRSSLDLTEPTAPTTTTGAPMSGTAQADTINGNANSNLILGQAHNDRLFGNGGDDVMLGGDGRDYMVGGSGEDALFGGAGNDRILGQTGLDVAFGDSGDDIISGGWGDDKLYGGEGNDSILGDGNDDMIFGGAGHDTLTGGSGRDVFVFEQGDGRDQITDFDPLMDTILLSRELFAGSAPGLDTSGRAISELEFEDGTVISLGGSFDIETLQSAIQYF